MTLESNIATLVGQTGRLTATVTGMIDTINSRLDTARTELDAAVAAVNGTTREIYVDAVSGDNANPGTQALPIRSVAAAQALSGKGYDRVVVLFRADQTHNWPADVVTLLASSTVVLTTWATSTTPPTIVVPVLSTPVFHRMSTGEGAAWWMCTGALVARCRSILLTGNIKIVLPDTSAYGYPYHFWQGWIRMTSPDYASRLALAEVSITLRSPLVCSWGGGCTIGAVSTMYNNLYVDPGKGLLVNNVAASPVTLSGIETNTYHYSNWQAWILDGSARLTVGQLARALVRYAVFPVGSTTPSNIQDSTGFITPTNLAG